MVERGVLFLLPQAEFFFPFSFAWGFYYLLIKSYVKNDGKYENEQGGYADIDSLR